MTDEEVKTFEALKKGYMTKGANTALVSHARWLVIQMEQLIKANESLTFQLQDRIKLEHDNNAYVEVAKEKCTWVHRCATLTRKVAELEDQLKGK